MPAEVDKQVEAIVEECMKEGRSREECERMAWAIVNSRKTDQKEED